MSSALWRATGEFNKSPFHVKFDWYFLEELRDRLTLSKMSNDLREVQGMYFDKVLGLLREISRLLVQAEHPDSQQRQSARAHRDQVCDKLAVELKQAANDLEADKSRIVEVAAIRAMLNTLQHELAAQAPNAFA